MAALKRKMGLVVKYMLKTCIWERRRRQQESEEEKTLKKKQRNNWSLPCRNSIWGVCLYVCTSKSRESKQRRVLAYSNRSTWLCGCLVLGRCWLGLRSRENTLELLLKAFLGSLELPVWAFVVCFPLALVFLFGCQATANLRLESKADSVKSAGKWTPQCLSLWFVCSHCHWSFIPPTTLRVITINEQPMTSRTWNKFPFWIILNYGFINSFVEGWAQAFELCVELQMQSYWQTSVYK